MAEHYTTADGVDVTEGDSVYVVSDYGDCIVDRQIGRGRVMRQGFVPFRNRTEASPQQTFFEKATATAFLIARVEKNIVDALQQIKNNTSRVKRLRKLAAKLRQQNATPAEGSATP